MKAGHHQVDCGDVPESYRNGGLKPMFGDSNGKMAGGDFGPLVVHLSANFGITLRAVTKEHLLQAFDYSIVTFGGKFWLTVLKRLEN